MSDSPKSSASISDSSLYDILKNCAELRSYESLQNPDEEYFDDLSICDDHIFKRMSMKSYLRSASISDSSCKSDDSFIDSVLEENGRISLAYENLRTIPRRIAEKFAAQTKFLDLSYNNFKNLSFLTYFEDLHTLILDHNEELDPCSLPYLPSLEILWINNCEISNVAEWIRRIQKQCPMLKHLSIMGNPGVKTSFSINPLNGNYSIHECSFVPTSLITNCRDYILYMLPDLQYLDGVARVQNTQLNNENILNLNGKSHYTESSANGSNNSNHKEINGRQSHVSPTLSFKDLFTLKRRKKIYQSSSTN